MLPRPIYQAIQKTLCFEWRLEPERTLEQVHAAVQVALSPGLYNPVDPMVLAELLIKNYAVYCLSHTPIDELQWKALVFRGRVLLSPFES